MTKLFCLVIALALGFAAPARAEDEKKKKKDPDVSAVFAKLDANSDKKVSKEEFDAFKGLGTPKPGKENKEPKGIAEMRAEWFKKLDANADGNLTGEEFAKGKEVAAAAKKKKKEQK
jgi:hypothetical protein